MRPERRDEERAKSSQADYEQYGTEQYGTELATADGTMDDLYGDGSKHSACQSCGMCVTCGDCATYGCGRTAE